jgi:hypothetical protein
MSACFLGHCARREDHERVVAEELGKADAVRLAGRPYLQAGRHERCVEAQVELLGLPSCRRPAYRVSERTPSTSTCLVSCRRLGQRPLTDRPWRKLVRPEPAFETLRPGPRLDHGN